MFLTETNKERIVKAIKDAELNTSGEIKVHVEETCPTEDPMDRAKQVFQYLCIDRTAQRNGVLFYLAHVSQKFAILGDEGIDKV
ncbi:MAG TPA: TPM domain-containing protein, partial [Emticicia sp.]